MTTLFAAVQESAYGTFLPSARAIGCPVVAKGDIALIFCTPYRRGRVHARAGGATRQACLNRAG
jgi:hypothetical protein